MERFVIVGRVKRKKKQRWRRGGKREFERVREDGDAKKTTTTSSLVVVVCVQALKLIFLCRVFAFGFFASYLFCSKLGEAIPRLRVCLLPRQLGFGSVLE